MDNVTATTNLLNYMTMKLKFAVTAVYIGTTAFCIKTKCNVLERVKTKQAWCKSGFDSRSCF